MVSECCASCNPSASAGPPGPIRGEYCDHVTGCGPITAHLGPGLLLPLPGGLLAVVPVVPGEQPIRGQHYVSTNHSSPGEHLLLEVGELAAVVGVLSLPPARPRLLGLAQPPVDGEERGEDAELPPAQLKLVRLQVAWLEKVKRLELLTNICEVFTVPGEGPY